MLLLTGCAAVDSDPPAVVCPPVVAYDQATMDRAAAELEALPPDSALAGMMADYVVMRDQTRACRNSSAAGNR